MATTWTPPKLADPGHTAVITARQADILAGICHGHTHGQIATRIGVSEQAVRHTAMRLFRALGARERAHAAALACSGQLTVIVAGRNGGKTR